MNDLFFIASKILWFFFRPDVISFFLLILVWIFLWKKAYKKAKHLLGVVLLLMIVIATLPVGSILLQPLESRFETNPELPKTIDGIIVLSGAIGGGAFKNMGSNRGWGCG